MNQAPTMMFDHLTFAKLGLLNPADQRVAVSILNGCVAIASETKLQSLKNLAISLKRKATEIEPIYPATKQDDRVNAVLKENSQLKEKIQRINKDMDTLKEALNAQQAKDSDAALQLTAANEAKTKLDSKTKECEALKNDVSTLERSNGALTIVIKAMAMKLENRIMELEEIQALATHALHRHIVILKDQISNMSNPPTFIDPITKIQAICPIPTRDGHIVSLATILRQWKTTPGDSEGEVNATFQLNYGVSTCIGSSEQVSLIRQIAFDLKINITSPLQIQYRYGENDWYDVGFYEHLMIFSKICKLIRHKATASHEKMVINCGIFLLSLKCSYTPDITPPYVISFEILNIDTPERVVDVRATPNDASIFSEVEFK